MGFNDYFSHGISTGIVTEGIEVTISSLKLLCTKIEILIQVILSKHVYDLYTFRKTVSIVTYLKCRLNVVCTIYDGSQMSSIYEQYCVAMATGNMVIV